MDGPAVLLHGRLVVKIFEARDCISEAPLSLNAPGFLKGALQAAESVVGLNANNSDCYATVNLSTARVGRTRIIHNTIHPVWNETFQVLCCHDTPAVVIGVKDDDNLGAKELGKVYVSATMLLTGREVEGWYNLLDSRGNPLKHIPAIRFSLQFFDARIDPAYNQGVGDGISRFQGLVNTYYPLRTGCSVQLFQDAHVKDGAIPPIHLAGHNLYEPDRCWEEVYKSIVNARHFIYIAGWSVCTTIELVRDLARPILGAHGLQLGNLLKQKAEEGVRVLLLVWDDKTNNNPLFPIGVMGTHDQETMDFFKGSKVHCVLCPRNPDTSLSAVQGVTIGTLFTHHQKMAVMDAPPFGHEFVPAGAYGGGQHQGLRLTAFVGGIDLTSGRYDNQDHSLFRTFNGIHGTDFAQSCLENASLRKGGPREPWHDIHSRADGAIAWDVHHNFEQRWRKQAGSFRQHLLLPLTQIPGMAPPGPVTSGDHPERWSVQLLRSIDGGSVEGFPEDPNEVAAVGLASGKGNVVERSVQEGMVQAIRRAQTFLYLENQYFLGSCHLWAADQSIGATNTIPGEIALKIVRKIEAGERFAAYIVIPMYPDGGVPSGGAAQAILAWQRATMSMMYARVAAALRAAGRFDEHPKDFLSFFCLGQRESPRPDDYVPTEAPPVGTYYRAAQLSRRFMVYVHAKLTIVDDEFAIVGSANVNQRSQDGSRDTELAIGAFQPCHLAATSENGIPRGQVHALRMSLWAEHLGGALENTYLDPSSVHCIRRVNELARYNWELFAGSQVVDLPGHLMPYPVQVGMDGTVSALPDCEFFPDTVAPIAGKKSATLPEILTT